MSSLDRALRHRLRARRRRAVHVDPGAPSDEAQPGAKLDWLGLALLSPSLALIIYGLAESSAEGGFGHAIVLGPVIVGAVLFGGFVWNALRKPDDALLDLRLFRNGTFTASFTTMILVIISVFGAMLLLPLYLQSVRGESALMTGLLLAPQGLGAMIAMPIAGRLTDMTGVGRFVPVGLAIVAVTFLALTQIGAETSYLTLSVVLFFMGLGMGGSMMPLFSGAMQTLRRAEIARASTALNINQQVGASFGTAILSVLLASALTSRLGDGDGSGIGGVLPDRIREAVAPEMADAYGSIFLIAFILVAIAFVVALVVLPKDRPEPVEDPDGPLAESHGEHVVPVLV